jgi:hypothetical protein
VPRIERFPLRLPIRYRPVGTFTWAQGTTENISARGVFVSGSLLPELNTPLDFRFEVAVGLHRSQVACRGAVVRTVTSDGSEGAFAATINDYRFLSPAG